MPQDQLDSIFTSSNVFIVNIQEITEDVVKYSFLGEEILSMFSINTISKIVFRTGRIQTFAEKSSFGEVKNGLDWEHVTVIQNDRELKGLY